jgi:shikimate dehydrogenase
MQSNQVSGTTTLTGLIGNPVFHSISPIIHNHAFSKLNLDYSYIPLGVKPEKLEVLVEVIRALNFAGANVTIPFKQDIIKYCDEISPLSKITGAVNTLYFKGDKLCGTTTDADGFLQALKSDGFSIENKKVVILGNGGTARTLAMVLAYKSIANEITIIGRNLDKVRKLTDEIKMKTDVPVKSETFSSDSCTKTTLSADIIVNCTSVGMHPNSGISPLDASKINSKTYVFDAIYNPAQTELLKIAEAKGCKIQNGLKMLLFQGLESFKYWTGKTASEDLFDISELQSMIES